MRIVRVAIVLAILAVLLPVLPASAAPIVPFAPRFTTNDTGAVFFVGNNLLSCPTGGPNCSQSRDGVKGAQNNNQLVMTNLDVDADPFTRNSSSGDLLLPAGSEVLWAGLYWGARLSAGDGGAAAVGDRAQLSFRGPGEAAYSSVTAARIFGPTAGDQAYQGFADVTARVRARGSGTYWAGNVAAGTGKDRYGGWSLAVVFRNPGLPLRNLTVFDGFTDVGQGSPQTIDVSGFLAPLAGEVQAEVRLVAYEGDFTTSGDTAQLEDTQLGTTVSPGSNFFNGANDLNGASVPTRNTTHKNMLGFDIKRLGVPGALDNGATSATISLESTGDRYFPGVVAFNIDLYAPDFSTSSKNVINLGGTDPARVGDVLQYTLTYTNSGQDPAASSVVEDSLPPNTEYVPESLEIRSGPGEGPLTDVPGDDRGEVDGDVVRVRLGAGATAGNGGTIGVGDSTTVTFQVRLLDGAAGTTVENRADLAYVADTLDQPFTYRVPPTQTPVAPRADLSLLKTTAPDPGIAGSTVTSTLTVTNAGPNPASDVVVSDSLPDGVTLAGSTASQGSCAPNAGTLTCALGTISPGAPVTITVTLAIPPGSDLSSLLNTATVESTTDDPDPSNNTAGSSVGVIRAADLAVTKSVSATTVTPGTLLTYTMTATNTGPSDATNVVITDVAPADELVLLDATAPGATCSASAEVARCTVPTLAAGQSVTMTVTALVPPFALAGVALSNSVQVTSDTADPDPDDNQADVTVITSDPVSDLQVTKVQSGPAQAGGEVTYAVTVVNEGPSRARDVVLTDPLPAGFTAVSATSSRGECVIGPPVSCAIGDLLAPVAGGPPGSATVTIVAAIDPDLPAGPVVNAATATSSNTDPTPDDATGTVTTSVLAIADLSVAKTANPQQPAAGENVTFTVTVTNQGPATARAVQLTDVLPAGLTLVSSTPPAGAGCTGNPLVCDVGDLAVGATAVLTVVMNVPPNADLNTGFTQTASVTSSTIDPSDANNSASATITSRAISDLIALKFINSPGEDPVPLTAGTLVTYQLAVGNIGPSDATTAQLVDVLPPGVTFVSSVPECSNAGQVVTCVFPSVPNQFAAIFPITVRLAADLQPGSQLTNAAVVTLTDPNRVDPVSSNNVAVLTNPVLASADVSVSKNTFVFSFATGQFIIPAVGPPGSPAGFQITLRNDGPSVARDVVIDDVATLAELGATQVFLIKPGEEPVDITGSCNVDEGALQCPVGDMPVFAPGDVGWGIQVNGAITSDATPGSYVNSVTVSSSTPDGNPANDESTSPITVTDPVTTLTIGKTNLQGDPLVAGETFGYRLDVNNVFENSLSAASDAPDVVVTDTLPPGFTPTTATASQGTCTISLPSTVTCELGTVLGPIRLEAPPPVFITITGTIATSVTGTVTNTAAVTSPISAPATDTLDTEVIQQIDVFLIKTPDSDPFVAGAVASWTLVVGNAGPSDATFVEAGELLPPDVTFLPEDSSPGCFEDATVAFVTCPIGTLAAGETTTLVIAVQTSPDTTATELVNRAIAASQRVTDEVDFSNNEVTVTTPLVREADLTIVKVADSPTPSVGTSLTYTIGVDNAGPSTAADVVVTDELLPGLVLESVTTAEGRLSCSTAGSTVTCSAPTLEAGTGDTIEIVVSIPDGSPPGPLTNTASVSSATGDPDPSSNVGGVTVDVGVVADLRIDKTVETNPVVSGQPVTFRLNVTNNGPATAPDVTTSDTLPPGTTFVSAEAADGCVVDEQEGVVVVTCTLGPLAPGASAFSTLTLIAPTTGTLENVGSVGSGALDPCPDDGICLLGDDQGNSDGVSFEVINRPPVAVDDLDFEATTGVPLEIDVVANDVEPDGEPLEITAVTQPTNGTSAIGSVVYTSNAGYVGPDSFEYTICDPQQQCDVALVTVTVVPPDEDDPAPEPSPTAAAAPTRDTAPPASTGRRSVAVTGAPLDLLVPLGLVLLLSGCGLVAVRSSGRTTSGRATGRS